MFLADVKAQHDKMVEFRRRVMRDKRGTRSAGCSGRNTPEPLAVSRRPLAEHDLPKAKPPHEQESIQRQIAATDKSCGLTAIRASV